MMFCPKCGTQNADNTIYCVQCNERMDEAQQPAYAQQQQGYQGYNQQGYQPPPYVPPVQQSYYNQPYQQQQPYYGLPLPHPGDSAASASLVCGIIGIFFFGLILGIIALVQGAKAKKLGYTGGKATAGIVLGVIDLVGWAVLLLVVIIGAVAAASYSSYYYW